MIIKLAELATAMGTGEGSAIIWSTDADLSAENYPPDGPEFQKIINVMRWMETVGTLYRNGVVNEDLLFDWIAITPPGTASSRLPSPNGRTYRRSGRTSNSWPKRSAIGRRDGREHLRALRIFRLQSSLTSQARSISGSMPKRWNIGESAWTSRRGGPMAR
ncbi:MAG: hypothetical protein WD904_02925 [Dehalococcoidia bacterium]